MRWARRPAIAHKRPPVTRQSIAAGDVDRALFAVTSGDRYRLIGAARHIGALGWSNSRRAAMDPIPWDVIGAGGAEIRRRRRCREVCPGLADRTIGIISPSRPEAVEAISAAMLQRMRNPRTERWMGMRRRKTRMCCARPGGRLVCCKQQRDCADGGGKRPEYSTRHGINSFGYWPRLLALLHGKLSPPPRARKPIIN